jgi:hypothetical protein
MLDERVLNGRVAWAIAFALLAPAIPARSQDAASVAPRVRASRAMTAAWLKGSP